MARGQTLGAAFLAVFEVHDSDVEGLLRNLRDESQAMNDGVVLLRGLPFTSTKEDIADFFSGNSAWAALFLRLLLLFLRAQGKAHTASNTTRSCCFPEATQAF